MSAHAAKPDAVDESPRAPGLGGLVGALRDWATASKLRSAMVGCGLLGLIAGTIATWLYLATVAVEHDLVTIDLALEALDHQEFEKAEKIAQRLRAADLSGGSNYGGTAFVLGALKALQADSQWSFDKRRTDLKIAARYLDEARVIGFPRGRENEGYFLLGRSLVETGEYKKGIESLEGSLHSDSPTTRECRKLLANAYVRMTPPQFRSALRQYQELLEDPQLSVAERSHALLERAQILITLRQFVPARVALEAAAKDPSTQARRELLEGLLLSEDVRAAQYSPNPPTHKAMADQLAAAQKLLLEAQAKDKYATDITNQALFIHADIAERLGDRDLALEGFTELRKLGGASPDGIAASLREADLLRLNGEPEAALDGYRRALDSLTDPAMYQSLVMSLEAVRQRVTDCHQRYVAEKAFSSAMTILDRMHPLFSREKQTELRAQTLAAWGQHLLDQAASAKRGKEKLDQEGRLRLREAAQSYVQLAEMRFATAEFPDDIWRSAELYYKGHNYKLTIEAVTKYLNNEADRRNAPALLLLGQAYLAKGENAKAIRAFEECIEFHPRDAAVHQARLDCAKAFHELGNPTRAEELLNENLSGGELTPRSIEWRHSLFELGYLLHAEQRFHDAIIRLEEAIDRYPKEPQAELAKYLIAESYRRGTGDDLTRLRAAQTLSEQEKYQKTVESQLNKARQYYEEVAKSITLRSEIGKIERVMLRNCYMLQGSVLFDLGRYREAYKAYSSVATLYQNEPFALETQIQIANCWSRLGESAQARGAIEQAKLILNLLPPDADFQGETNHTRQEWVRLLQEMSRWWEQT